MIKLLLSLFIAVLPNAVKRYVYNHFFGYDIHPTASIGLSLINVKNVKMGPHARIKHFCVIKGLECLEIGAYGSIGVLNRFSGVPLSETSFFQAKKDRYPALIMGEHSAIVSRHYFDCNDTITIGRFTTIAGLGCAFWTHGINIKDNVQETAPIEIGDYCLVSARVVVIKGAKLPDYSVLGANSTLHKAYDKPYTLYSGVPAVPVTTLDSSYAYFHRKKGAVD
tara:strand:- start:7080 stop:7748 length:669 start_codon:yes stop_codon:yes gene_type:complete